VAKFDPRNLPDLERRPIFNRLLGLYGENKYTFDVTPKAAKPIKAAIEGLLRKS